MIPKKIHYCWVGGNPLPDEYKRYIAGWKRLMPDVEIIEWNETNYDFTKNAYMAAAYREKKWGFVPDYARLDIIYQHGGIYLDTDVEVIKPLYPLLEHRAFFGFEALTNAVALGLIFGAEPRNPLIKKLRDQYEGMSYYNDNGSICLKAAPVIQTEYLVKLGLKADGSLQEIEGCTIYPSEYFSPKDYLGNVCFSEKTYTIHHYSSTWMPLRMKICARLRYLSERYLGGRVTSALVKIKRAIWPKYQ